MSITVNPQLIFQWLVLVGERCRELSSLFKYELYCFPSALFESSSLPLQPNKPVLANALWKSIHESQQETSEDVLKLFRYGEQIVARRTSIEITTQRSQISFRFVL